MATTHPYPVARIGIIGGGQLGRMLVLAAHRLGCACVVLDPEANCPAGQVAEEQIVGDYHQAEFVRRLAAVCDVITYELEHIDTDPLLALSNEGNKIQPSPEVLSIVQDKLKQKQHLDKHGIPSPKFIELDVPSREAFADFGYPLVQKARRGGYDGRGVAILQNDAEYGQHLPVPSMIEQFIDTRMEIAVLVARGTDGQIRCYPAVEMTFEDSQNILDTLIAPARISSELATAAEELARNTVEALGGVGIFGVEMFVTKSGELLLNEVAPRTHNSGHHTIEACVTDQFEQHLRAITGLPLGDTALLSPAVLLNLLGEPGSQGSPIIEGLTETLSIDGVAFHIYGKASCKPHRKMGHLTVLGHDVNDACAKAEKVRATIKIHGSDPL